MLKVTTGQVAALDTVSRDRFEAAMVVHLSAWSPITLKVAKPEGLKRLVSEGVDAALEFRLIRTGSARLFLELICLFGPRLFDDPLIPWAGRILRDPYYPDDMDRAVMLRDAAAAYMQRVNGVGFIRSRQAFEGLRRLLDQPMPDGLSRAQLAQMLTEAYRERALDAGPEALLSMIDIATADPETARLPPGSAPAVAASLHLALGVAAFGDLRHPWVARAMDHPANETPFDRQERLLNRARLFLDAALDTMAQEGGEA